MEVDSAQGIDDSFGMLSLDESVGPLAAINIQEERVWEVVGLDGLPFIRSIPSSRQFGFFYTAFWKDK